MNLWDALDRGFERELGALPRPIAPCPLLPPRDIPADRSDESRDAASTGV